MNPSALFQIGDLVVCDGSKGRVVDCSDCDIYVIDAYDDGNHNDSYATPCSIDEIKGILTSSQMRDINLDMGEDSFPGVTQECPEQRALPNHPVHELVDRQRLSERLQAWVDESEAVVADYRQDMNEWSAAERAFCNRLCQARQAQIEELQQKIQQIRAHYEEHIAEKMEESEQRIAENEATIAEAQQTIDDLTGRRREATDVSEAPNHLCCPITLEVMVDPVIAADGITYERSAIQRILSQPNPCSPNTNLPFETTVVFPNVGMRALCREWEELSRSTLSYS